MSTKDLLENIHNFQSLRKNSNEKLKLRVQEKTQINWGMDKQLVYSHQGILLCNEKKLLIHGKDVAGS